jgi:hypothetical protein
MSDETKPQDSAAMPPASAGSHGPALWALEWKEDAGRIDPEWVYGTCEEATEVNETGCYGRATVVPLYRSPTLTDEEREAVEWFACYGVDRPLGHSTTLRSLLARTDRTKKDTRDGGSDV